MEPPLRVLVWVWFQKQILVQQWPKGSLCNLVRTRLAWDSNLKKGDHTHRQLCAPWCEYSIETYLNVRKGQSVGYWPCASCTSAKSQGVFRKSPGPLKRPPNSAVYDALQTTHQSRCCVSQNIHTHCKNLLPVLAGIGATKQTWYSAILLTCMLPCCVQVKHVSCPYSFRSARRSHIKKTLDTNLIPYEGPVFSSLCLQIAPECFDAPFGPHVVSICARVLHEIGLPLI